MCNLIHCSLETSEESENPVAVPGIFLADGAAASSADRGHSLRSLDSAPGGAPIAPLRKFLGDSLHTFSSVRKYERPYA